MNVKKIGPTHYWNDVPNKVTGECTSIDKASSHLCQLPHLLDTKRKIIFMIITIGSRSYIHLKCLGVSIKKYLPGLLSACTALNMM